MITVIFLKGHTKKVSIQIAYDDFIADLKKRWKTKEYDLENGKRITIKKEEIQAFYEPNPTKPISEIRYRDNIRFSKDTIIELPNRPRPVE